MMYRPVGFLVPISISTSSLGVAALQFFLAMDIYHGRRNGQKVDILQPNIVQDKTINSATDS